MASSLKRKRKLIECTDSASPITKRKKKSSPAAPKPSSPAEPEPLQENLGEFERLKLLRLLHSKDIDTDRKLEIAYEYISHGSSLPSNSATSQTWMKDATFVLAVSNWIQAILISSSKQKQKEKENACFDCRAWAALKWCLGSPYLQLQPTVISPNLIRPITTVLSATSLATEDVLKQMDQVLELLFHGYDRYFRPSLESWSTAALSAVSSGQRAFSSDDAHPSEAVRIKIVLMVLRAFVVYIDSHPSPRNVFGVIVDKLLEPLLWLLAVLSSKLSSGRLLQRKELVKAMEEILASGLFHPAHIDGYLDVCKKDDAQKPNKEEHGRGKLSYHKSLFNKLGKFKSEGKLVALQGIGTILSMYYICREKTLNNNENEIENQKEKDKEEEKEKEKVLQKVNVFNVFMELMEPLLADIESLKDLRDDNKLSDSLKILLGMNSLLSCLRNHKIYIPTEDTSEQTHFRYLKRIFLTITELGTLILVPLSSDSSEKPWMKPLVREVIENSVSSLNLLMQTDYRLADENLHDLWLLLLCYLAVDRSSTSSSDFGNKSTLFQSILQIFCQIIQVYSELRQVDRPLFTMLASTREMFFSNGSYKGVQRLLFQVMHSFPSTQVLEALSILLTSYDFLHVIATAILALPEGQFSHIIKLVKADAGNTMAWLKNSNKNDELSRVEAIKHFNIKAEVAGRLLSEVYVVILDNSNVTANNSVLVGNSIKELVSEVSLCLVPALEEISKGAESLSVRLARAIGIPGDMKIEKSISDSSVISIGVHWLLVFLLRLYISCRSNYRQCISLMPPKQAAKASLSMGEPLTASSVNFCLEEWNYTVEGYFSWICESPVSVVNAVTTIMESVDQRAPRLNSVLLHVLHNVAIQRLVDLNKYLSVLKFFLDKVYRMKLARIDCADDPHYKQKGNLKKHILVLNKEGSTLTELILKNLDLVSTAIAKDNLHLLSWDSVIGTLSEHSLATAGLQLLCNNVDIWSQHASKKSLKKFVSNLLENFLHLIGKNCLDVSSNALQSQMEHQQHQIEHQQHTVTMEGISLRLMQSTAFYEQKFLCRYLCKTICRKVRKSVAAKIEQFSSLGTEMNVLLSKGFEDWPDFSEMFEEFQARSNENVSKQRKTSQAFQALQAVTEKSHASVAGRGTFGDWIDLLHLLRWIPKCYYGDKYVSMLACHILNIERFLIIILLKAQQVSNHGYSLIGSIFATSGVLECLHLFVACREALLSIFVTYSCDEFQTRSSVLHVLFGGCGWKWLSKSIHVFAECLPHLCLSESSVQKTLADNAYLINCIIYKILDLTSQIFILVCEEAFTFAADSLLCNIECGTEAVNADSWSDTTKNLSTVLKSNEAVLDIHSSIEFFGNNLKVEAESTLLYLGQIDFYSDADLCNQFGISDFAQVVSSPSKFSSGVKGNTSLIGIISLIGGMKGIIWGLATNLQTLDEECCKDKTKTLKWRDDLLRKWMQPLDSFQSFVNACINKFLVGFTTEDRNPVQTSMKKDMHRTCSFELDSLSVIQSDGATEKVTDVSNRKKGEEIHGNDSALICDSVIDVHDLGFPNSCDLEKSFLNLVLKEGKSAQATLLGELFMTMAGIVKLKHLASSPRALVSETYSQSIPPALMNLHTIVACWLLLQGTKVMENSTTFSFDWMYGILKYLECIGNYVPYMDPAMPSINYGKLLKAHIQAMASLWISSCNENKPPAVFNVCKSNNNMFQDSVSRNRVWNSGVSVYSHKELKHALLKSFTMLVRKPLLSHFLLVLQSMERSLAGNLMGCNSVRELDIGSQHGGRASKSIAAALESLNLLLDSVSGTKRMKLLAKYSKKFVSATINIILHLQGSSLFTENAESRSNGDYYVDSMWTILKCIQILFKVASRHTNFPLDSMHVAQSLSLPAVLFQHFLLSQSTGNPLQINRLSEENQKGSMKATVAKQNTNVEQWRELVFLYRDCCRLLSALLRHHTRETGHCVAILEESLRILLFCLEAVDMNMAENSGGKCLTLTEGVECGSWLRRVYEELGQHKDLLGRYCSHILSDYICVFSGFGPKKSYLRREIDEALRPGVYALVDVCSSEDLQQLHAGFGEGPRRNALKALKLDYEKYFKYTGKV